MWDQSSGTEESHGVDQSSMGAHPHVNDQHSENPHQLHQPEHHQNTHQQLHHSHRIANQQQKHSHGNLQLHQDANQTDNMYTDMHIENFNAEEYFAEPGMLLKSDVQHYMDQQYQNSHHRHSHIQDNVNDGSDIGSFVSPALTAGLESDFTPLLSPNVQGMTGDNFEMPPSFFTMMPEPGIPYEGGSTGNSPDHAGQSGHTSAQMARQAVTSPEDFSALGPSPPATGNAVAASGLSVSGLQWKSSVNTNRNRVSKRASPSIRPKKSNLTAEQQQQLSPLTVPMGDMQKGTPIEVPQKISIGPQASGSISGSVESVSSSSSSTPVTPAMLMNLQRSTSVGSVNFTKVRVNEDRLRNALNTTINVSSSSRRPSEHLQSRSTTTSPLVPANIAPKPPAGATGSRGWGSRSSSISISPVIKPKIKASPAISPMIMPNGRTNKPGTPTLRAANSAGPGAPTPGGPPSRASISPPSASAPSSTMTSSAITSPALMSSSSSSRTPGSGSTTNDVSDLLASKSNYQHIMEGTHHQIGLSYPETLSAELSSKKTSHKLAEQGRRNRINTALQELATEMARTKPGPAPASKADIVETAIAYIKELHGQLAQLKKENQELKRSKDPQEKN